MSDESKYRENLFRSFRRHLIDEQLQLRTREHLPKIISIRVSRYCDRKPPAITALYQFLPVLGCLPSQLDFGARLALCSLGRLITFRIEVAA
jgi:hypothetical protein